MSTELKAVSRRHAADEVFDQLATAILRRELAAGSALPPERELATRFLVSPLIARQAIHRLAELGLARVRQGGATLVCDPDEASDVRVIGLLYGAGARITPSKTDDADILTKQMLQGFCLVQLAEMRGNDEALSALPQMVDALSKEIAPKDLDLDASTRSFVRFDERFWRALASATKSRIFKLEVGFWYAVLVRRPEPPESPIEDRVAFYRELAKRLATRSGAADFYLAWMRPVLQLLEDGAHAKAAGKKRAR